MKNQNSINLYKKGEKLLERALKNMKININNIHQEELSNMMLHGRLDQEDIIIKKTLGIIKIKLLLVIIINSLI